MLKFFQTDNQSW